MAILGRWTGGVKSQGNLPETWTAPTNLFDTQARNDGSAYTFTGSTSTLTLPSSGLADGYLLIGRYEYDETDQVDFNPQGKIIQTGGTGNFIGVPAGCVSAASGNDDPFVSCWAFIDNPSASATFQFQWRADISDGAGGTNKSSFDVIPFYYADISMYSDTDASLYGGTTPNVVSIGTTEVEGTNITRSGNVVTVTGDNKRYVVLSAQFYEGREGKTQRWFGHDYDGTQDRAAQAFSFTEDNASNQNGNGVIDIIETATASRTIEITCYRGDNDASGGGGAADDGVTPTSGLQGLVVVELNDSAEVFRSKDDTGGQALNVAFGTVVDLNIARTSDIDFNDSASWTRASDIGFNAEVAMDALVGANMGASYTAADSRYLGTTFITVNGSEDGNVFHGNYCRGPAGGEPCWGYAANPVGFVSLSAGDDVGAGARRQGDNNEVTTQAGWVGFWGINLDTLEPTGNDLIDGSSDGVATVTGTLTGAGKLLGQSDGLASTSGVMTGIAGLSGSTGGVGEVSGTLGQVMIPTKRKKSRKKRKDIKSGSLMMPPFAGPQIAIDVLKDQRLILEEDEEILMIINGFLNGIT